MSSKIRVGFLLLVVSQILHSLEEYYNSLWEVFPPARFASQLVSDDPAVGFAIINTLIILFGLWTYFAPVQRNWRTARAFLWFWVLLELGNTAGHTIFSITFSEYIPGLYTAPALFVFSCYLVINLLKGNHASEVAKLRR